MGSPATLDFDRLLAAIPGDNPAGADLRSDYSPLAEYRVLKDARAAARAAERSVVFDDEPGRAERPDWGPVLELAPRLLAERSKDLEISAWLVEALVREQGFAGLRDGFRLARELAERFWDGLYPLPDEDGVVTRVAPLAGLNGVEGEGALITPITNVPITAGESEGPFHLAHYRQASDLERMEDPDKRAQRIAQGAATVTAFEKAVRETPPEFFQTLLEDLGEACEEFDALCAVLEERCGKDESGYPLAPPSSNIRNLLRECRETVEVVARPVLGGTGEDGAEAGTMVPAGGEGVSGRGLAQVRTREDAFRALLQVADFFKHTEPHSPVSYALEQAVRWGRMPLPDLLSELVPEEAAREQIFKLIGIRREGRSE